MNPRKSQQLINAENAHYKQEAEQAWFWVTVGILAVVAIIYGVWRLGTVTGEAIDRSYCNTVSEQAYDGQPCPKGTRVNR